MVQFPIKQFIFHIRAFYKRTVTVRGNNPQWGWFWFDVCFMDIILPKKKGSDVIVTAVRDTKSKCRSQLQGRFSSGISFFLAKLHCTTFTTER
jgi:hypothetical protein